MTNTDDRASGETPAEVPWHTRVAIGLVSLAVLAFPIPFYADSSAWRWTIFATSVGAAATLAFYAKPGKAVPLEAPTILADPGIVEDLASRSIDRADRAMVGWLTVVGAAHSAFFAAVGNSDKLGSFTQGASKYSTSGAAFLVLGVLCYAASHAMLTTRQQATRALRIASKLDPLGPYFQFVYREDEESTKPGLVGSTIGMFGFMWIVLGAMFSLIAYVMRI